MGPHRIHRSPGARRRQGEPAAGAERNLLYVIIAEATNMGLDAMAESCSVPYDVLAWTAEWITGLRPNPTRRACKGAVCAQAG
jgi:hypothetical protein